LAISDQIDLLEFTIVTEFIFEFGLGSALAETENTQTTARGRILQQEAKTRKRARELVVSGREGEKSNFEKKTTNLSLAVIATTTTAAAAATITTTRSRTRSGA
jgi:hypothetical protein